VRLCARACARQTYMEGEALGGEIGGSGAQGCIVLFAAPPAPTPNTPAFNHTSPDLSEVPRVLPVLGIGCVSCVKRAGDAICVRRMCLFPYAVLGLLSGCPYGTGPDWSRRHKSSCRIDR